jgi:pSer/pThr/pTyr-binding forkhead associated (FHA) protein
MAPGSFQLTMRSGPNPDKVFPLEKAEIGIGRDLAGEVVINDAEVSRHHARMVRQPSGEYVIEDNGSTNGTFINGDRVSSPQLVHDGDIIGLGEHVTLVVEEIRFDPEATVAAVRTVSSSSPVVPARPVTPQPAPIAAPPPPPPPVVTPPPDQIAETSYQPMQSYQQAPPAYNPEPQPSYQQAYTPEPPPSFAGQVPEGPTYEPPAPPAKKKFPVWIVVIIAVVLLCICACGATLYYIDANSMWCQLPAIGSLIPGC